MDIQRKSWVVTRLGSLKNLELQISQIGSPKGKEILVKVKAIGLNYADIFSVMGLYKAAPKTAFTPGLEFAGEVLETGPAVTRFKKGDKVMGVTKFGAYTTCLSIDERYADPLPQGWTFEQGAAFPVQVLTAYYALGPLGNVQKGQTVLIHSAAGGVGMLANRIAKKMGAYTIGVIGSESKKDFLKKEGYDESLVRSGNFKEELNKALQGKELNLVLETTGGKYMQWSYDMLAPMGRMVCYGSAQFTPQGDRPNYLVLGWKYLFRPKFDPLSMITANKSILAFNLIWLYEKADLMRQLMSEIDKLELPAPYVGHRFKFEQLPEALRIFKRGKTTGKVIIEVE